MDRQTWMDGGIFKWMHRWMSRDVDGWEDRQTQADGWMNRWTQMDGQTDRQTYGWVHGQMD